MMAKNNTRILQQFDHTPVLIAPTHVEALQLFGMSEPREQSLEELVPYDELCASSLGLAVSDDSKTFVFSGGMAVIPVYGVLLHRDSYCSQWATGYDYIRTRLAQAIGDPEVKGIVFDVHSYGGMARGCFELCDLIYAAREKKPTLALVDGTAYSAAYAIASSAERIVTTPSSEVGSIGVLIVHTSYESMLANMGIKTTFVYSGKHKVDGNAYEDLPKDVKAQYQEKCDKSYQEFVSTVARNRGLDADAVRATEALCYDANDALGVGLIDAIHSPSEALAAFRQELDGSDTNLNTGVSHMSNTNSAAGGGNAAAAAAAAATPTADTPAAVEAPVAVAAAPVEDAGKAQQLRIKAITTCEHAKGREQLANHLAFETEMTAEAAIATLAAAPAPAAAAPATSPFAAAMDGTPNPNVGAGGDGADTEASTKPVGTQLAESYRAVTGQPLRKTD